MSKLTLYERQRRAIIGSIEKWKNILLHDDSDRGTANCALCKEFMHVGTMSDNDCDENCPVCIKTGQHGCHGTPYTRWVDHHTKYCKGKEKYIHEDCPECYILAAEELKFLQDLLKDYPEKPKEEMLGYVDIPVECHNNLYRVVPPGGTGRPWMLSSVANLKTFMGYIFNSDPSTLDILAFSFSLVTRTSGGNVSFARKFCTHVRFKV